MAFLFREEDAKKAQGLPLSSGGRKRANRLSKYLNRSIKHPLGYSGIMKKLVITKPAKVISTKQYQYVYNQY